MNSKENREKALTDYFTGQGKQPRPIITSLNGDNSWLLSFPRPPSELRDGQPRAYFHVAVDPWLNRTADILSSWFLHMERRTESGIPDVLTLAAAIAQIETAVTRRGEVNGQTGQDSQATVDAIFISAEAGDHCHKETLMTFSPDVPIFAASAAARNISAWNHFRTLITLRDFDPAAPSWRDAHPGSPLPKWLTVTRLLGATATSFAMAVIASSGNASGADEQHELILFTPHGILPTHPNIQGLLHTTEPPLKTLAMLHPLKEVWTFGIKAVLGVSNGLALERESGARYWVRTAGSDMSMTGFVTWFQTEIYRTLQWGLGEEEKLHGDEKRDRLPHFVEVENGECFVLE